MRMKKESRGQKAAMFPGQIKFLFVDAEKPIAICSGPGNVFQFSLSILIKVNGCFEVPN